MKFYGWNIFSKTPFFRKMSLFLQGGWVVNIPTPSHSCHRSSFGGGGWVLKEIWSMSLNNPLFFNPSLTQLIYRTYHLRWPKLTKGSHHKKNGKIWENPLTGGGGGEFFFPKKFQILIWELWKSRTGVKELALRVAALGIYIKAGIIGIGIVISIGIGISIDIGIYQLSSWPRSCQFNQVRLIRFS